MVLGLNVMGLVNCKRESVAVAGLAMKNELGVVLLCALEIVHALPVVGLIVQFGGIVVFNTASFNDVMGVK